MRVGDAALWSWVRRDGRVGHFERRMCWNGMLKRRRRARLVASLWLIHGAVLCDVGSSNRYGRCDCCDCVRVLDKVYLESLGERSKLSSERSS